MEAGGETACAGEQVEHRDRAGRSRESSSGSSTCNGACRVIAFKSTVEGRRNHGCRTASRTSRRPGTNPGRARRASRASMQSNRGRDTSPELAVRRRLHAMGLRYRVSVRPIPNLRRTADIVFTRARVAVFIDGCFWHGCPEHYQSARAQRRVLAGEANAQPRARRRDRRDAPGGSGWTPLRFWEHEVKVGTRRDRRSAIVSAVTAASGRCASYSTSKPSRPSRQTGGAARPASS